MLSVLAVTPFVATRLMVGSERPRPVLRGEPVFEPDTLAALGPYGADAPGAELADVDARTIDLAAVELGPKVVRTMRVRAPAVPMDAPRRTPDSGPQSAPVVVAAAPPAIDPPAITPPETIPRPPINRQAPARSPRAVSREAGPDVVGSISAHNNPDLPSAAESRTAVYDIAGHTVYMPNGDKLEAHSGLGAHFDDPRAVHIRMRGATPPNTYTLSMRERPFHGVAAIRMKPAGLGEMFGRDGILAHSYMLGPRGESNGCVSFKDYDRFLAAFRRGEVTRMVVVARTAGTPASVAAARRSADVRYAADRERR